MDIGWRCMKKFSRSIWLCVWIITTACSSTHTIRTIGNEAKLYRNATIQSVLLKDGTRLEFESPGARYQDSSKEMIPVIAGRISGKNEISQIKVKDILEIVAELQERSPEKTLIALSFLALIGLAGFLALLYFGGIGVH